MADFEYFRAEESDQFSFFRIPKALFTEKEFASLSTDAKLLYGILLDRISLSKKNGWIDSDGYVYIIYTIAELQELLRMSHTTVTKLLYELDQLRHTYASNLLANGAAPKDVQELLGHSDVSTTMNVYAHSTRDAKRKSVRLLDKVVGND